MRLYGSVRGMLGILAALALAGCDGATAPTEALDVSVELSSNMLRAGDRIDITVTAVNQGGRSVAVQTNYCPPPFVVTTANGEVAGPGGQICALAALVRELAPSEQVVLQTTWDGNAYRSETGGQLVFLDPGEYQLVGYVVATSGVVKSAPVAVKIVE